MTYSDNPRKVYGKVKIIYSDGEISSEMAVLYQAPQHHIRAGIWDTCHLQ